MLYPDDFTNTALFTFQDHYYAIHDDCWYRLWGWMPGGGRAATVVSDPSLIERLDHLAVEVTGNK